VRSVEIYAAHIHTAWSVRFRSQWTRKGKPRCEEPNYRNELSDAHSALLVGLETTPRGSGMITTVPTLRCSPFELEQLHGLDIYCGVRVLGRAVALRLQDTIRCADDRGFAAVLLLVEHQLGPLPQTTYPDQR
jgi:hypothetical protein